MRELVLGRVGFGDLLVKDQFCLQFVLAVRHFLRKTQATKHATLDYEHLDLRIATYWSLSEPSSAHCC